MELDQGSAAILTIQANNGKVPFSKCDLKIKSSDGLGLMVMVETGVLRQNSQRKGKCIDYLQLGRDDNTPFFTWDKSDKFCGQFSGTSWSIDSGELLVWLRLGQWDNIDTQESLHLSLVVTQYKISHHHSLVKYRSCQSGKHWIRQEYFCDGRVNCAEDEDPADEDESVCLNGSFQPGLPTTSTTLPPGPPLNLLSITLILVSVVVILFLFCLLIVRLKTRTCLQRTQHSTSCELPEHVLGGGQVVATVAGQHQPTVYLDLSSRSLLRGSTPETEPPPAYNDLFPPGYKYLLKCQEETEADVENANNDNATKETTAETLLNSDSNYNQNSVREVREDPSV